MEKHVGVVGHGWFHRGVYAIVHSREIAHVYKKTKEKKNVLLISMVLSKEYHGSLSRRHLLLICLLTTTHSRTSQNHHHLNLKNCSNEMKYFITSVCYEPLKKRPKKR